MKKIIIFFVVACLFASLQLKAQNCIDTVHVKGYYIVKKKASELKPRVVRKENVTSLEQPVDVHFDPSFIPCDSINKKHPLSFWLNHFFADTRQVFISCEKFGIGDFIAKECLRGLSEKNDSCHFPVLKSKVLYQTTNLNTGDVFEIYYIDAHWAKAKIKRGSLEADLIPSKIAQRCISSSVSEFDLYCFTYYDKIDRSPTIKDAYIKIWKN